MYQIKATEGVQVLVPARLIGELKGLPENVLSAREAVREALMSKYTKFCPDKHQDLLATLVRTRLTQNLARLIPQLKEEVEYITATEFPECRDWTPVKFQPFALRCVARTSGRAFVGPSICRQEAWMDVSINFAVHIFLALVKLQFFPAWLRPAAQYLVPDLGRIRRDERDAREMLAPVIEERLRDMEGFPGYEGADDLIQWLLEALPEGDRRDYQAQAELQLILSAASIHTTNNLLVDCVYDLAAHPEVAEELRLEAAAVLEGPGAAGSGLVAGENGWARKDSMTRLKKLDSFMQEVQRLSGNVTSFIRKAAVPINLSDGTHLPAGTRVLAPQCGISHDPRYFPDPERFDALRSYRMRLAGGAGGGDASSNNNNRHHQFTSISDTNMNFGAGRHACPGRFFAGNEVKMILAYFLINYEIRLKDGEERPRAMMLMMSKTPDPNVELLFRRRMVGA